MILGAVGLLDDFLDAGGDAGDLLRVFRMVQEVYVGAEDFGDLLLALDPVLEQVDRIDLKIVEPGPGLLLDLQIVLVSGFFSRMYRRTSTGRTFRV